MLHDENLKEPVQSTEKMALTSNCKESIVLYTLVTIFLAFYRATECLFFSMLTNVPCCRILEASGPCNQNARAMVICNLDMKFCMK